jgi:hypothetical protein
MNDFVTCGFGRTDEQVLMVRRWIDAGAHIWAGRALDGVNVHIHAQTRDGLDAGVNLPVADAGVLADYAEAAGHPGAASMAKGMEGDAGSDDFVTAASEPDLEPLHDRLRAAIARGETWIRLRAADVAFARGCPEFCADLTWTPLSSAFDHDESPSDVVMPHVHRFRIHWTRDGQPIAEFLGVT